MADAYSHGHQPSVVSSHARRGIEDSAAYLVSEFRDGMTLLDVGCGPGSITLEFARRFPHSSILGIDASDSVIAQATEAAQHAGLRNVRFEVGDAYALDVPDESFDVVHAHQVLQHLSRPVEALKEFRRVRTADGLVAVRDVDYEATVVFPEQPEIAEWLDLYLKLARRNGGEPAAGRRLRSWALAAGFTDITPSATSWLYATDERTRQWGETWSKRTLESNFATQALEYGLADQAALQRIADGFIAWGERSDAWFQFGHGEVLARG